MQRFTDERVAAFQSADRLAEGSTDRLGSMLRRIVWEIALTALLVVAAALGGGLILMRRWRAAAA
jgi:LPS O-antigen subunit length determinant protein (WzzB/FepE family)